MRPAIAVLLACIAGDAMAASLTVTTTDDTLAADGQCSLREAITAANTNAAFNGCPAGSGDDVVVLGAAEYRLDRLGAGENANLTGDLDVRSNLTVQGAGADATRIRGDRDDRVFDLAPPSVGQFITVDFDGVTVRNGDTDNGGAIFNASGVTLTVTACSIVGNLAVQGGAIASLGILDVSNSVFHANSAASGGAIWTGGAGNTTIRNVTFDANDSSGSGAVASFNAAAVLNNLTLTQNIADSDLDDIGDGAIEVNASVVMSNSIVARNVDLSLGGGNLLNPDCMVTPTGTLTSAGHNLIGNIGNVCVLAGTQASDQVGTPGQVINPLLQPFAIYGGSIETNLPTAASPAVERGSPAPVGDPGACEADDARGVPRPQGARCDIGAAELDDLIFRDGFDPPLP